MTRCERAVYIVINYLTYSQIVHSRQVQACQWSLCGCPVFKALLYSAGVSRHLDKEKLLSF